MADRPRVFERAAEDERRGDLGSARQRLRSFLHSSGYHPEAIEQVARLSMRMRDPYEAGRWYSLIDSKDPESAAAIELFQHRCGGVEGASGRLPLINALTRTTELPPAVRARVEPALRKRRAEERGPTERSSGKGSRAGNSAVTIIGLLVVMLAVILAVVGLRTVLRSVWGP